MAVLRLILLCVISVQESPRAEDHSWLRFKVGTWIEHRFIAENGTDSREFVQRQTLTEKIGDNYTITQSATSAGKDLPSHVNKFSISKIIGNETISVNGKEYPCAKWESKGRTDEQDWETVSWMPTGNRYPLRIVTKQASFQGDVSAIALEENVKVGDREYVCAKLHGKVKFQGLDGVMTVWMSQQFPGSRVRSEMTFTGQNGQARTLLTPLRVHEEK